MGLDTGSSPSSAPAMAAASSSATSSPNGKRNRDPEDEVYLDNLHSHKRYLSEIMASSLNGLTVGDSLPDNIVDSPSISENMLYISNGVMNDRKLELVDPVCHLAAVSCPFLKRVFADSMMMIVRFIYYYSVNLVVTVWAILLRKPKSELLRALHSLTLRTSQKITR